MVTVPVTVTDAALATNVATPAAVLLRAVF